MNLFIIPSWYPNRVQPLAGIFFREQAEAIAAVCPDIRVMMSTWGHHDAALQILKPKSWFRALDWRLKQESDVVQQRNGVWELFNPTLSWNRRLPLGGASRLVSANRRNLDLGTSRFGKIDLIHAHASYPAGNIAAILKQKYGIPYVLTEHMGPFPFPTLIKNGQPVQEVRVAFREAAATIAVSPSLADRISSFGFSRPTVIPNVVDERRFTPAPPVAGRFIFFTLCGLTDQKGIDHLLRAISLWNPVPDQVEFRIGGDGPKRQVYEDLAKKLGVEGLVRWLGHVSREKAPTLFQECHAYVMPSLHETFGVVYAEAIASGKPVIATRCGGPESIVHEGNGLLVDVGDTSSLAEALASMVSQWHRFDSIAIRKDFEQRFSRSAVVDQLRKLYETVLAT